jgi:hypothetical protein
MRESRLSGSVEGVMSNHDPYSDSPSPLVGFSTTKVYSGIGADIVMESISRFENWRDGSLSVMPRSDCLTEPYGIVSRWKLPGDVS